jgi:hypothetical protein
MRVSGQRQGVKGPDTHYTGAWVGYRPVWTGTENLAPAGVRTTNCPTRSESVYRLCCPAPRMLRSQGNYGLVHGTSEANGIAVILVTIKLHSQLGTLE